jgi:hypothetical protein
MNLETARRIKQEIGSFVDDVHRRPVDGLRFGISKRRPRRLAVGIAPTGMRAAFHLALRAESEADLPQPLIEEIRRRTAKEVDVRFTGPIHPVAARDVALVRPLAIGASVAHYLGTAGSLGFFAQRSRDGAIGMVSNNHVLAAADRGSDGDDILQPAPADRGTRPRDTVAGLAGDYPRLRQARVLVDCAFALLVDGMPFDPAACGRRLAAALSSPNEELTAVSKIGRTTGLTNGRITAFEVDQVCVSFPFGEVTFDGQIEIEPTEGVPFSRPGDSGSLVFTSPHRHPLGLLFCSSSAGGPGNLGLAYANPLHSVLSTLGVAIVT